MFCAGTGIDLIFVWWSKMIWFQRLDRNWLGLFRWSNLTWFHFRDGIDLVFVCGGRRRLGFSVWIEINKVFGVEASKLTWFKGGDQNGPWFQWWVKTNWIFVWGIEFHYVPVWVVEIYLIPVRGSKLTWFQCRDRKWLGFCVGIEKNLVLVSESKWTWFMCDNARP